MPSHQRVPEQLRHGPFTLREALDAGLARWHLESQNYRRLGSGTYVWAGLPQDHLLSLQAVLPRLPPESAFCGHTAAWLHGLDVLPCDPIEVVIPELRGVSGRAGMKVSRARLDPADVVVRKGMHTTSILRTLLDLGQRLPLVEAVVIADAALHQQLITLAELSEGVLGRARSRNVSRLRRVVELAEAGAESQMESRLRMLLILAGVPRPEVQVPLYDDHGAFIGRPDLYYPTHRLAIEYDGGIHRDKLVEDNRRQNRLLAAGIRPLRFTGADVYGNPASVIAQVRDALSTPPAPALAARRAS